MPCLTIIVAVGIAGALCELTTWRSFGTVLISATIIYLSLWMMQKTVGLFNLRALTIPALFYFGYLALVLVPAFFIFSHHPEPYRTRYLVGVESVMVTVPLGVLFINLNCRFHKQEIGAYFREPLKRGPGRQWLLRAFLLLFAIALALSALYVRQVRTIPLIHLITSPGNYDMLVMAREESLKLMSSHFVYAYSVLRSTLYPLLILIALGRYLSTRDPVWCLLFVSSLAAGLIYSALTIAKSPVSNLVLIIAFFFYLYRGGRIGPKAVAVIAALFLAFPVFIVMVEQAGRVGFLSTLQDLGHRLFVMPAEILYYYFRIFPDVMPHQHGATIGKLAWFLGEKTFDDANFVGRYMMLRGAGFRSTVTANAPFVGSLYTDFGFPGVFIGGFLAGAIMQALQVYILRRRKTYLDLALLSFLLVTFCMLNATTLPIVLLSDGALLAFAFVWCLKHVESRPKPAPLVPTLRGVYAPQRRQAIWH